MTDYDTWLATEPGEVCEECGTELDDDGNCRCEAFSRHVDRLVDRARERDL